MFLHNYTAGFKTINFLDSPTKWLPFLATLRTRTLPTTAEACPNPGPASEWTRTEHCELFEFRTLPPHQSRPNARITARVRPDAKTYSLRHTFVTTSGVKLNKLDVKKVAYTRWNGYIETPLFGFDWTLFFGRSPVCFCLLRCRWTNCCLRRWVQFILKLL